MVVHEGEEKQNKPRRNVSLKGLMHLVELLLIESGINPAVF